MFRDREEAANRLARKLAKYRGTRPLVLGVPRGAVTMAAILADQLEGELDVVLVRKLGAPGQPELAVGAVDETGWVTLDSNAAEMGLDEAYIEAERKRQWLVLLERRKRYTPARPPIDPRGRNVIVVDDGVATGATLAAALRLIRAKEPKRLVAASAVAPAEAVARLRREADEVVVLASPERFLAVGAFFSDFHQVEDDEVVRLLLRASRAPSPVARWEHFEHPAGLGLRGIGSTVEESFEQAALALTAVVADPSTLGAGSEVRVTCEAPDLEGLLVDWLNAVIYEMSLRKMLFGRPRVRIQDHSLEGTLWGEPLHPRAHEPAVEVKGATYAELRVAQEEDQSWVSQCVVDV